MNKLITSSILLSAVGVSLPAAAQQEIPDSVLTEELQEVVVSQPRGVRKLTGTVNAELIGVAELCRAACCNLGESFSTNPSVDVTYSDAATGARQIRLLGLSGQYVQMLTENIPNFRGAAAPYGLGYVPGPWMQSIMVSKGASSVKNGYESITGQINIEMKKPQADPSLAVNMYGDMMGRTEANVSGNMRLSDRWSAGVLTHAEKEFGTHDSNGDGFIDTPGVRQISFMPRVAYMGGNYVFQAAAKVLDESRKSGQHMPTKLSDGSTLPLYTIDIDTRRVEAYAKNAFIFDRANDGNIALITSVSNHKQDAVYGLKINNIDQTEGYASLMFERKWTSRHALSTGLSGNYDRYRMDYRFYNDAALMPSRLDEKEAVGGGYVQYTYNLDDRLMAMAGVREDYSSRYGWSFVPRLHLRYNPSSALSFHGSAGRGLRSPHPRVEFSYILASSRSLDIAPKLDREDAWNFGGGGSWTSYLGDMKLGFSGEYYYTHFSNYLMLNLDATPHAALVSSIKDGARSHALQLEVTFEPIEELTLTGAWRFTDVQARYTPVGFTQKPLTARHKGLFTLGWAPNMGIWQLDASLAINGGGRMPTPDKEHPLWKSTYGSYVGFNAQITRNFRRWALYVGGENLTNFTQRNPIVEANDPWGRNFDATMIYGPLRGAMVYAGFRYTLTKY